MPTIDLFIKSYKKDFWLLHIALETIRRNVTGYNSIILLIPEHEKHDFDTRNLPDRTLIHYVQENYSNGWMHQQVFKLQAYKYSNADYIMFSDSDCLADHPINLQDFIVDDRPEILYTDWARVGDAVAWRAPTERFMKGTVDWEFMRRNNCVFHRSTLEAISQYEPNIETVVMNSEKFSEFNVIGAFAFKYERHKYNFINTDDWTYVEPRMLQVWSHADKNGDELHMKEWIRVLESVMKAFNVPVPVK